MDIKEKIKIPKIHKNEINEFIKEIGTKSLKNFKYYKRRLCTHEENFCAHFVL